MHQLTLDRLTELYLENCRAYYRKPSGKPTNTAANIRSGLNAICETRLTLGEAKVRVGRQRADRLTPQMLRAIQQQMASTGKWARSTLNLRIRWLQQMIRWAAMDELVPADLPGRLSSVQALKRGRSPAPDRPAVTAIEWEHVAATIAHADLQTATMIEVHWHTGMRPGELVQLAWSAIDRTTDPWLYRPPEHKLEHHGRDRIVPLGPTSQSLLSQWALRRPDDRPWAMHVVSYARRVRTIQQRHGLTRWHPNQIRHATATRLRRAIGIEAARVVLGHRSASTTEIYAEADVHAAQQAIKEHG